ncbi:MAG: FAD-dependent thymidylate synthase [Corynebacterium sp.]|nr:FAD-dependent thymidylate synthase [Corynebacterium sp.]
MAQHSPLTVELIACSAFQPPSDIAWAPNEAATQSEALIEFAGRACYESFDKPNPRTAATADYIRHILQVGHSALLEHPTATLYIRGLSRGASHELMRHRHFSFSQLSQRYVHPHDLEVIVPDAIADDEQLRRLFLRACDEARFAYEEFVTALNTEEQPSALARKQARQAARAILPNATETRVVVTGNFRTWRHFIGMRASEHADPEIRGLAVRCLKVLQAQAPAAFADFEISTLADGTEMATSAYVSEI